MTMGDDVAVRAATADDWDEIHGLLSFVFHDPDDEEMRRVEGSVYEPERGLVATDGPVIVGHAAAYTRELTVPGAILPAAHVTLVGVAPTHRRRGILSRMMRRQLTEIAEAGREPIAVLWASEGRIYPRFGYGLAAQRISLHTNTRELSVPGAPSGRLRLVEPARAIDDFTKVYEQLRADRVGWSSRDDRWWRFVLADLPSRRHGGTERHGVVHEGPDGPTGYATWRTTDSWDANGPTSKVSVSEVIAADPETYAGLWRFLLTLDLTRSLHATCLPLDDPIQHLVDEPRQLGARIQDGHWVRIIDLPAALTARRYVTDVDVVLDVTDPLLPGNTGRWRLTGDACEPTTGPADLACTITELGAAYQGGTTLAALAAAGRVRELTPGAVNRASRAFGWYRMPMPLQVF